MNLSGWDWFWMSISMVAFWSLASVDARSRAHVNTAQGTRSTVKRSRNYWKEHYVHETDPEIIEEASSWLEFKSGGEKHELLSFISSKSAPSILLVPGTGDHPHIFAEVGYLIHLKGWNVFIMSGFGFDWTIDGIIEKIHDAVKFITVQFSEDVGVAGFSLGGLITFHYGLADAKAKAILCQDPSISTEPEFHEAFLRHGAGKPIAKYVIPPGRLISRFLPWLPIPISVYLDFAMLLEGDRERTRLDAYLHDPDIDHYYSVRAAISQINTPTQRPLETAHIPTAFLMPSKDRAWAADYIEDLYRRLPDRIAKKIIRVDGGHYWLLSHPKAAAETANEWFAQTLRATI